VCSEKKTSPINLYLVWCLIIAVLHASISVRARSPTNWGQGRQAENDLAPRVPELSFRASARHGSFVRFGSRTDLYLPPGARLLVAAGQRMIGGETVVAELDAADATPRPAVEF
jgi:hypothetical protein